MQCATRFDGGLLEDPILFQRLFAVLFSLDFEESDSLGRF